MPFTADNHMIVNGHAEQPPSFGDPAGNLDVGPARFGRSAGVVVNEYQCARANFECPADNFARMDRGFVDGSFGREFVPDKAVLRIEIENPDPLIVEMGHVDRKVVEQRLPAADNGLALDFAPRHSPRRESHDLQCSGAHFTHPFDLREQARFRVQYLCKRSEPGQQRLGHGLSVASRPRGEQQIFEYLIIGQGFRTAMEKPVAQPRPVALAPIGWGFAAAHAPPAFPLPPRISLPLPLPILQRK